MRISAQALLMTTACCPSVGHLSVDISLFNHVGVEGRLIGEDNDRFPSLAMYVLQKRNPWRRRSIYARGKEVKTQRPDCVWMNDLFFSSDTHETVNERERDRKMTIEVYLVKKKKKKKEVRDNNKKKKTRWSHHKMKSETKKYTCLRWARKRRDGHITFIYTLKRRSEW